ncbi:MAG: O-antigen ligase [Candidatus Electronema aureum]|uniref:O-antigen ligase n=1 Tax=Candidatus Electronema aureum TaxID=2005002 RepID=A0A521G0K8_9BACT|nr:MAG: O-antigen ligase [Candidatus Electronema aureum]
MAFVGFVAVLFFAPLAFGTTEIWSTVTAQLLVTLTAVVCFFPRLPSGKAVFYRVPGVIPLVLCLVWLYAQCIPLPFSWVQQLSPGTAFAYQPVLELLPPDTWIPLTVNRQATLLEGMRFTAYALFYILTVQLLISSKKLSTTVTSIVWLTLFIAFASMLQRAAAPDTLFWVRPLQSSFGSFGPWVYKNQYAGFMVMTCPLVLAFFLLHRPLADKNASFRERLLHLFSGAGANLHFFFGFGVIVVLASVLLAQSRGGILSLAFALLLFFFLLARSQGKIQTLTLLVLVGGLLLAGGWFSWEAIFAKFDKAFDTATGTLQDARLPIWQDAVKIIPHFLLTGAGFGSFIDVFPSYKSFADSLIYDHAHNDYLELLTDGGLIGFFLAAWFVGAVLRSGWRQIFRRKDRLSVLTAIAAFSGIAGLLFFSITDFNLHNWANGLYFFFLCGLLVSAGHTRQHYQHRPTLLALSASPAKARTALFLATIIFALAGLLLQGGEILADRHYQRAQKVSAASSQDSKKQFARMAELIEEAGKKAPLNGSYLYALGNIRQFQQQSKAALLLYSQAALLQPMEGTYLQSAGLLQAEAHPLQGRMLVETGYRRSQIKDGPLIIWAEFELSRKRRARATHILRQELERDPRLLNSIYPLLTEYRFTQEKKAAVVPQLTSAWLNYAQLARTAGNEVDANYFTEHALDFIGQEPKAQPQYFMQVFAYYQQQKEEDKAIEVLREGIKRLPDYAPFHIYLGDYYKGKGIDYRAIEEYEQALLIQPINAAVQQQLKQLKDKQQTP